MSWSKFDLGCCCNNDCLSRWEIYRGYNSFGSNTPQGESDQYYGLNIRQGDYFYNPFLGMDRLKTAQDADLLIIAPFFGYRHHYGEAEFLEFLDRGKTIIICGEYIPPFSLSDQNYIRAIAGALGAGGMTVNPGQVHMPFILGDVYGNAENFAVDTNNLNKDLPIYSFKAASTVSGGIPIVTTVEGNMIVGMTIGNGKVLMSGDGNIFETGFSQLLKNICENEFIPIG